MNYLIEFDENIEEECKCDKRILNTCIKCEMENLNVEVFLIKHNQCFIRTNNINKFIEDWNELFVFQISKENCKEMV